ncbi:hypothetical protein [Sphingomonas echinoides]|uniref:hypothetical protein n=1 Tax=Sphingomonas echinoides TaxID=59803 RepID=UPI0024135157|nr:hypothetical protein [Sphingomonas echinoides]
MTDKPKDPPIVEMDYLSGLKVIDIGDIRVARGMSRRPHSSCNHRAMVYDPKERRVWCKDCETDVEPFDAFEILCQNYGAAVERIKRDRAAVEEAKEHNLIRIAAKQMDEHFRQRNMVPACPHCNAGIFPEDVAKMSSVNKEWELAKRARKGPVA